MLAPMKWVMAHRPLPASTVSEALAAHAVYDADRKRPLLDEQIRDITFTFHGPLTAMLYGAGTEEAWENIAFSLNLTMALAEAGFGEQYLPRINEALAGVFAAQGRAARTGKWGFDGSTVQAVRDAFEVHAAQLEQASKNEVLAALATLRSSIAEGNVYREAA